MAIGQETGVAPRLGAELSQIAALVEEDETVRLVFDAPVVSKDAREKIIESICQEAGFHDMMQRFLKLLNQKGRLQQLVNISRAYQDMLDESEGRVRAEVISAAALSSEAEQKIKNALAKLTGKEVIMSTQVDAGLIGGVVTRVEGKLLDGSVRTQLKNIEENLKASG
jgi:F-type H+-transporting ATPase subunit delta